MSGLNFALTQPGAAAHERLGRSFRAGFGMDDGAWRWVRRLLPLMGLALLSACGGGSGWNGQRGYDGHGDYGYDLNASRAEAHNYRERAQRHYPVPGPPGDPWGPYIRQAAARYAIPDTWIRTVMRQESGGRLVGADGSLTTSSVGAMGLMQVMPQTYDMLRRRYGLGDDPYEPHDNIMAGAGYIREMYDRFGAPGFLAAYNAGPDRLDAYLAGTSILPDETINYLARTAPRLGNAVAMTGPLAVYAGGGTMVASQGGAYVPNAAAAGADPDAAYAGGGMVLGGDSDGSGRAFDGGGLVTAAAPTGNLTGVPAPDPAPVPQPVPVDVAYRPSPPAQPAPFRSALAAYQAPTDRRAAYQPPAYQPPAYQPPAYRPPAYRPPTPPYQSADYAVPAAIPASGAWGIQVGAFPDPGTSRAAVAQAQAHAAGLLAGARPAIIPVQHGGTLFRARLVGLSSGAASLACTALSRDGMACFTVPPGS
jgi:hypothetical protein